MASPIVADALEQRASVSPTSPANKVRTITIPRSSVRWGVTALFATLLAWPLAIAFEGRFPVENLSVEMTNRIRNNRDDAIAWAKERSNRWESMYRTSVACLTGFGAVLGCVSGLLGATKTAPLLARMRYLLAGLMLGALFAAAGAYLEAGFLIKIEKFGLDPMYGTMLGHAVAWTVIAVGLALSSTLSVSGWSSKLGAAGRAAVGALLAAVCYPPIAAILFPLDRSDLPIPEGNLNKLLFLGTAAVLTSTLLGYVPNRTAVDMPATIEPPVAPLPETSRMVTA